MNTFFILSAKYLYILPALILGVYFLMRQWPAQKRMALFALPSALLTYLLGLFGGYLYYDPRPFIVGHFTPLLTHAADNGFPSDHTLLASALAMIGFYWNRWLGVGLWVIAIVIAVARVYVGVHHPVDVLASMIFAIIGVSTIYGILKYAWHKEII
ncbi:MAG: phosphatase PAP2 family protein [Minisyncoccota bacterium]